MPSRRFLLLVSGGLAAWNNVLHLVVPAADGRLYVPLNEAATAALLALGRRHGLSWSDLGLGRHDVAKGLRWGATAAALVTAGVGTALAVPRLRPLLDDARVRAMSARDVVWRALVRIPIGTAVFEEVAFRGVLYAGWRARTGPIAAAAASSAVFGLWHVRPTIQTLDANRTAVGPARRMAAVVGAVVATGAGGMLFCALRERSGSLWAPILAHTAANSLTTLASLAARR